MDDVNDEGIDEFKQFKNNEINSIIFDKIEDLNNEDINIKEVVVPNKFPLNKENVLIEEILNEAEESSINNLNNEKNYYDPSKNEKNDEKNDEKNYEKNDEKNDEKNNEKNDEKNEKYEKYEKNEKNEKYEKYEKNEKNEEGLYEKHGYTPNPRKRKSLKLFIDQSFKHNENHKSAMIKRHSKSPLIEAFYDGKIKSCEYLSNKSRKLQKNIKKKNNEQTCSEQSLNIIKEDIFNFEFERMKIYQNYFPQNNFDKCIKHFRERQNSRSPLKKSRILQEIQNKMKKYSKKAGNSQKKTGNLQNKHRILN